MNKTEIGKFLDAFEAEQLRLLKLDPRERAMQANYSRVMGVMYEVRDFLRKMPTADQQGEQTAQEGWISVKDRLPAEGDLVLIYNTEGIETAYYTAQQVDDTQEPGHNAGFLGLIYAFPGRSWGNDHYTREPQGQPTHWMPLPAAPSTAQPSLVCKSCGADRLKEDCKGNRQECDIRGTAQKDGGRE